MEMQKSVGRIEANLAALQSSMDSTKTKVDNLVELKNKIIGGGIVLGVVLSLTTAALTFILNKASDYLTWRGPAPVVVAPPVAQNPVPAPPAPSAKKP